VISFDGTEFKAGEPLNPGGLLRCYQCDAFITGIEASHRAPEFARCAVCSRRVYLEGRKDAKAPAEKGPSSKARRLHREAMVRALPFMAYDKLARHAPGVYLNRNGGYALTNPWDVGKRALSHVSRFHQEPAEFYEETALVVVQDKAPAREELTLAAPVNGNSNQGWLF
jgi:hypothetical protein